MKIIKNVVFLSKLQFDALIKDDIVYRFLADVTESNHDKLSSDNNGFDLRLADHETRGRHIRHFRH